MVVVVEDIVVNVVVAVAAVVVVVIGGGVGVEYYCFFILVIVGPPLSSGPSSASEIQIFFKMKYKYCSHLMSRTNQPVVARIFFFTSNFDSCLVKTDFR